MEITKVETAWVKVKCQPPQGLSDFTISHSTDAVCRITTDEGLQGIGEARGEIKEICEIINNDLQPLLDGKNPLYIQDLWSKMYKKLLGNSKNTMQERNFKAAIAAVDLALWDIKAKNARLSVCELLGSNPKPVKAYLAKGCYVEGQTVEKMATEIIPEMEKGGFSHVKIRVGRQGAKEAEKRVKAVRDAIGDKVEIMVDANQGWDLQEAIRSANLLAPYDIYWIEEPLKAPTENNKIDYQIWDYRLNRLKEKISIPLASGENHTDLQEIRNLINKVGPKYIQYDATKNGGVTEWLKVAALAEANELYMVPHHVPHFHAPLTKVVPNGLMVECYDNKRQHPAWPNLFSGFPKVKNGKIELSSDLGWGMEINDKFVHSHGKLVNWE